jgi:tRNA modification GTPase
MIIRNETIVALATPLGYAPLALIRVSGEDTFSILEPLFESGKPLLQAIGNSILFGYIKDPQTGETIDQVLVSVFTSPKSFTGENMVEISCHGGVIIFQRILDLLIRHGCVMAKPGEFSQRAFFNHKIDLTQAESIHDLIFSRSQKANQMILNTLQKKLSQEMMSIKKDLLSLTAKIEVGIDYPEEDLEIFTLEDSDRFKKILEHVEKLIEQAQKSQTAYNGIKVAIVGSPNAGKSSLLNLILGQEKAIVSPTQGTTRDPIEATLTLEQLPVTFIDTAGIRENPDSDIEQIGIQKSNDIITGANLVLLLHDASNNNFDETQKIIDKLDAQKIAFELILNKADLPSPPSLPVKNALFFSCKTKQGLNELLEILKEKLIKVNIEDTPFFINLRQMNLLKELSYTLRKAQTLLDQEDIESQLELFSFNLQQALNILATIDGSQIHEEILETIFSHFCVGK